MNKIMRAGLGEIHRKEKKGGGLVLLEKRVGSWGKDGSSLFFKGDSRGRGRRSGGKINASNFKSV